MSLEVKIEALTAAVEKNNELQTAVLAAISGAKRNEPVTSAGDGSKSAPEDKPKATRGRATKAKAPTVKEITEKTTAYLDVEDDTEYEERAALVVQITEHFGVKKMSEIADDDRALAIEMLDAAIAGDDPFEGIAPKEDEKPKRRALA